jgi:hypothetical protein
MADIVRVPLLSANIDDEKKLTTMDQVNLAQITQHPGWLVFINMMDSACKTATRDVIGIDPEEKGYQQTLMARQTRARNIKEFSDLLLLSVRWHMQQAGNVPSTSPAPKEELLPVKSRFIGPNKGNN